MESLPPKSLGEVCAEVWSKLFHTTLMLFGFGRLWYAVCTWIEYHKQFGSINDLPQNEDNTDFKHFTESMYNDTHMSYKRIKIWEMVCIPYESPFKNILYISGYCIDF